MGTYRVRVYQPGKSDFAGSFEVQSYQLEPIDLAFDLKKTVFYRGETVEADAGRAYQYGAPVAGRPIEVSLPDGRILHGTTDAAGKYHVEFPTEGFAEEQSLQLWPPGCRRTTSPPRPRVVLAVRGFEIGLSTTRDVYLDGESFQLQVVTTDAQGKPIGQSLSAALVKQITSSGRVTEREVDAQAADDRRQDRAAARSTSGSTIAGGRYIVRVAGTDRFGNPIVADRALTISGKKDETKLRLLADRQRFKVGEEASVNLHSRDRAGTALLTWEADRILTYKIVTLKEGDNPLAWAVDGAQFPNFTLTADADVAERVRPGEARRPGRARPAGRRSRRPSRPSARASRSSSRSRPSTSSAGPVAAELSIAMVDQSLLRLFNDTLPRDRPVLLRPDPHRRLRDRGDQHVPLRARHDGRRLRRSSKSASDWSPMLANAVDRRGDGRTRPRRGHAGRVAMNAPAAPAARARRRDAHGCRAAVGAGDCAGRADADEAPCRSEQARAESQAVGTRAPRLGKTAIWRRGRRSLARRSNRRRRRVLRDVAPGSKRSRHCG